MSNADHTPLMRLTNVCVGYRKKPVVSGVSLDFFRGETVALVGKNGCGKSTLLRTAAGRQPPLSGSVLLPGHGELHALPSKFLARQIAYLPQVRDVPHLTVSTMVTHGRFPYLGFGRILGAEDKAAVAEAMARMRVDRFAGLDVGLLSGGERQRVYLAMALCQQADLLLLDEPTTFLDMRDGYALLELLWEMKKDKAIVLVLHDLDAALRFADRVCLIDGGEPTICGTPGEVFESGEIERVYGLRAERVQTDSGTRYLFDLTNTRTES